MPLLAPQGALGGQDVRDRSMIQSPGYSFECIAVLPPSVMGLFQHLATH